MLEPQYSAVTGKRFMREFFGAVGLPLSNDPLKNVAYRAINLFLGVETDFSQFHRDGESTMRVTSERITSIINMMEEKSADSFLFYLRRP